MQPELWPASDLYDRRVDIKSDGEVRILYGEFSELLATEKLGAERRRIDGREAFNPDLNLPGDVPAECKSARGGHMVLFPWRLEKELKHVGETYTYVVIRHSFSTKGMVEIPADFKERYANSTSLYLFTLGEIVKITDTMEVQGTARIKRWEAEGSPLLNGRVPGWFRGGYALGYKRVKVDKVCSNFIPTADLLRGRMFASPHWMECYPQLAKQYAFKL